MPMPITQRAREAAEGVDRHQIRATLEETHGHVSSAAALLRVSKRTLERRISELGIDEWLRQKYPRPGRPLPKP